MNGAGKNHVSEKSIKPFIALCSNEMSASEVFEVKSNLIGFYQVLIDMDKQVQIFKEKYNEKSKNQNIKL